MFLFLHIKIKWYNKHHPQTHISTKVTNFLQLTLKSNATTNPIKSDHLYTQRDWGGGNNYPVYYEHHKQTSLCFIWISLHDFINLHIKQTSFHHLKIKFHSKHLPQTPCSTFLSSNTSTRQMIFHPSSNEVVQWTLLDPHKPYWVKLKSSIIYKLINISFSSQTPFLKLRHIEAY